MAHRATISGTFRWRLLAMVIGGLGFGGYFFFDASITYPNEQKLHNKYLDATELVGPELKHRAWTDYAREHGLPVETPKERSDGDINTQWLLGGISSAIGLLFLYQFISWQRRFVEGDEEGISSNGTGKIGWDKVTAVNASRWDRKGIAVIDYAADAGKGTIVLDDWKLDRPPADAIFDLLKANVDSGLISGLKEDDASAQADGEDDEDSGADEPSEALSPNEG